MEVGDSDTLSLVELSSIAAVGSPVALPPILPLSRPLPSPPSEDDESTCSLAGVVSTDAANSS